MRLFKFEYNPHLKWIILESALEKNVHYFYDSTILSDFFFIFIMSKLESPKNIAYKIWIHLDLIRTMLIICEFKLLDLKTFSWLKVSSFKIRSNLISTRGLDR